MQEYKKAFKNTKVTSFSSQISKEWKAMSEKEREKWKDMAEQDKIRFDAEKSQYTGPWVVPSDSIRKVRQLIPDLVLRLSVEAIGKVKNPLFFISIPLQKRPKDAPRRPPSAFLNYCQRRRSELKKENPDVRNTDISKLLGEEWKKAPANVRQPHIDKEACEREEYYRKVATWRRRQSEEADTTGRCIGDTMMPCSEAGLSIKISPSPPTLDASNTTIVDISPGGNGESSPAPMQKSEHELLLQMPSSGIHECKAPSLPSWDGEANVGDSVVDDALIPTVFPPLAVRKFLSQPSLAADPNREFQEQDIPDFGIPFGKDTNNWNVFAILC
jgi:hypothetical protein